MFTSNRIGDAGRTCSQNAILIVEFAKEQVDRGVDVVQAAMHASELRFRPILMTSLAFILGMLPMVIASGPGSKPAAKPSVRVYSSEWFGAVTVGILLVPFFFVPIYKMKAQKWNANNWKSYEIERHYI